MKQLPKAVHFSLFVTCCLQLSALDLTKVNFSYQYDINDVLLFRHRVTQTGDDISIYYQVTGDLSARWEQQLLVQDDYRSADHDTLKVYSLDTLSSSPSSVTCRLTIARSEKGLLLITYYDPDNDSHRIYDISVRSPLGFPDFVPVDVNGLPVLDNYVVSGQVTMDGAHHRYHVFKYTDDFGAADPAMGLMKAIAPTLQIDSSFYFEETLEGLDLYSFYLVQEDTFSDNGVTLLNCPSYYPEYRRLEELVGPLTYITTPNENRTLNEQMTRKAFENFWLTTYNTKFRAKSAIKEFYTRVELANRLFTGYKQGWKTDRGMLYIIFGPPDQVTRVGRTEVWSYIGGTEFEFIRLSTLFTPSLYSLKRDREYEKIWYEQVGNIRKGF